MVNSLITSTHVLRIVLLHKFYKRGINMKEEMDGNMTIILSNSQRYFFIQDISLGSHLDISGCNSLLELFPFVVIGGAFGTVVCGGRGGGGGNKGASGGEGIDNKRSCSDTVSLESVICGFDFSVLFSSCSSSKEVAASLLSWKNKTKLDILS